MSPGPVGGYTVFPATLTRAELIAVTLEALELVPEEVKAQVFEEHDEWESLLPEHSPPGHPDSSQARLHAEGTPSPLAAT
jgi:hypothetical protein